MDNLAIYNKVRAVPKEAQKAITGGRLSGKTDINPMWRLRVLTELFGPCGVGWRYTIDRQWLEAADSGEVAAFVNISLYIKHEGAWSEAIPGTGGSSFLAKESKGMYLSDECFKMALTDAISVACKALGVAADIYWKEDPSKYDRPADDSAKCPKCGRGMKGAKIGGKVVTGREFVEKMGMCDKCYQASKAGEAQPA